MVIESFAVNEMFVPRLPAGGSITLYQGRPLAFLLHYVRRHRLAHGVVLGSVFLAVLCGVAVQYGLKGLIDAVSHGPGGPGAKDVWGALATLCALIAADNMMWRVGGWAAANVFVRVTGDVRSDLFAHLGGHSPSYFSERLPGTLASRVTATSNAVFQIANTSAWNVLPPCFAVVMSIALIASVSPIMAAALAMASLAMAAVIFVLARKGIPVHRLFASRAAGVDGELVDVVGNMHVVRAFGARWREHARMVGRIGAEMAARRGSLLYLEKLRLIHAVITVVIIAAALSWGVVMWQAGQASAGDMVLICSLSIGILHCTRDLAVALVDLTQHVARLDEAITSLLVPHDMPDAPAAKRLHRGPGRVSFDRVRFGYPGRGPVLKDLDLVIEPGQRVGLVGASGAGKSTVIALLQRFYDLQSGRVLVDGQDIADVTQDSLREVLSIVPQDISLFHRTVLENIRYARPEAGEDDVMAAAEAARCRDFIEALPDGFDTMVGDRGVKLSGGQRQRLAIARALLKDAPILLLDEATSALDSESEQAIQLALDNLMHGRTVIAIAHRLSTLRHFDRIIVMDGGQVIDDGPPEVLSARPGPYRELLRKQMIDEVPLHA